jgi:hypothetical protein
MNNRKGEQAWQRLASGHPHPCWRSPVSDRRAVRERRGRGSEPKPPLRGRTPHRHNAPQQGESGPPGAGKDPVQPFFGNGRNPFTNVNGRVRRDRFAGGVTAVKRGGPLPRDVSGEGRHGTARRGERANAGGAGREDRASAGRGSRPKLLRRRFNPFPYMLPASI